MGSGSFEDENDPPPFNFGVTRDERNEEGGAIMDANGGANPIKNRQKSPLESALHV
jgi:hypothetical protein